jgi:hypothetical protein
MSSNVNTGFSLGVGVAPDWVETWFKVGQIDYIVPVQFSRSAMRMFGPMPLRLRYP